MMQWMRAVVAVMLPFLLASCVLAPGKFTAKMTIDADRSFAFSYVGEVYALNMKDGMSSSSSGEDDAAAVQKKAAEKADTERKNAAIAAALAKEQGYRSARYMGDGRFLIDYATRGVLTHHFVYPFNTDAEAMVPFIAIEVRSGGTVRMKAPGFANDSDSGKSGMGGLGEMGGAGPGSKLDGTFALETNAEIVSQNSEDGASAAANGRRVISWKASPTTKAAPMAVLRLASETVRAE